MSAVTLGSSLCAYSAVLGARFRTLLQYRAAALAGIGTQFFWGFILVMAYEAFYRTAQGPQPMTYPEVATYVWLGQAFLAMLPWNIDRDIRDMIRNGTVAYELLRPLDLYGLWYARALAMRTAPTLLRAVPLLVVTLLLGEMRPPPSLAAAGAWLLAQGGALLLSCAISNLMAISLFWTLSGDGVAQLVPVLVVVLSGTEVPLPLFPAWAQPALNFLPFRGLVDTPFRFYLGHLPPEQILPLLLHQLAWTAALVGLGRWLLSRGVRRLVVQGG
jgi:ABC-2 type transport system permease protein